MNFDIVHSFEFKLKLEEHIISEDKVHKVLESIPGIDCSNQDMYDRVVFYFDKNEQEIHFDFVI